MTESFYFKGKLIYLTDTGNPDIKHLCYKRFLPLNSLRIFKLFYPHISEVYYEKSQHSNYMFIVGHDIYFHKYVYIRIREKEAFKDQGEAIKYLKKFLRPTFITFDVKSLIWFIGSQRIPLYVFNNFMERLKIDYSHKINDYITLRIEGTKTIIYVNGREFIQCKYLLFNLRTDKIEEYDEIQSIDEAKEKLSNDMEGHEGRNFCISPITEFVGHCSNLQAWVGKRI